MPWITPADLSRHTGKMISRGARNITTEGLANSGARMLPAGTVLFSSRAPIGYVVVASNPVSTNQGFKSFIPETGVSSDYLFYYLQRAKPLALQLASGTTFLEISGKNAAALPVPLPPFREQVRVADRLDELLSDLDVGIATLERVRAKLRQYRTAVLSAAAAGALTADWRAKHPASESASELLARLLTDRRRAKWKAAYKEPAAPDSDALPKLPEGWCWATVEQISTKVVDGVHKKPHYVSTGVPFVTVRNLTAGPAISFEKLNYITEADHIEFSKRANPERGDILISKDGTLGVVREIKTDDTFSIFVSVALVKPVSKDMSAFLSLILRAPPVQAQMVPKGSGLVHIHLEDLRKDCVPLAPIAEQAVIVELVEDQLSVIDHLEADLTTKVKRAHALRQSILRDAFEGRLVPQDPHDESASELLERIATKRDKPETKTPRRRAAKH